MSRKEGPGSRTFCFLEGSKVRLMSNPGASMQILEKEQRLEDRDSKKD